MSARPTADRLLVEMEEDPPTTEGGIHVPDSAREPATRGVVVAAGPGQRSRTGRRLPMEVGEGDRVLFGKHAGKEVDVDGRELLLVKQADVLAVLEGAA